MDKKKKEEIVAQLIIATIGGVLVISVLGFEGTCWPGIPCYLESAALIALIIYFAYILVTVIPENIQRRVSGKTEKEIRPMLDYHLEKDYDEDGSDIFLYINNKEKKNIENLRLQVDRVRALKNEQLTYSISRALMNVNNKILYNKPLAREALMRVKIARVINAEMELLFPQDKFSISNLSPAEYIYEFYESGKYTSRVFSMVKHKLTVTLDDNGDVTL